MRIQLEKHSSVSALALDPAGARVAIGTADGSIAIYDVNHGGRLLACRPPPAA